jgi:predicted metal-dependent hydrolase
MPFKDFHITDQVAVRVYKRRANRNVRLSLQPNGEIRVSIPLWAPYKAGTDFAAKKLDWIHQNRRTRHLIANHQAVGKSHHIAFVSDNSIDSIRTRVTADEVIIRYPRTVSWDSPAVQKKAESASARALKLEAEKLLPNRLRELAEQYGFSFNNVRVKRLKSRWGSCDSHQNITLNSFLIQLPWELIDYVLLHELNHTIHMNHSAAFWDNLMELIPDVKTIRKNLRNYQPLLHGMPHEAMP